MTDHVSTETIRDLRAQLESLLQAVHTGKVTAPSGMVARLEGAITALGALLGDLDITPEGQA